MQSRKQTKPPLSSELVAELARHEKTMGTIITGVSENQLRRKLQAFTLALGRKTVPHGLRKNSVNVFLEAGCTIAEVASITGQTFRVVEHYAAQMNRRRLGDSAVAKLEVHRKNNSERRLTCGCNGRIWCGRKDRKMDQEQFNKLWREKLSLARRIAEARNELMRMEARYIEVDALCLESLKDANPE